MMTIAVPVWDGRVSPVLDVASRLLVVDLDDEAAPRRELVMTSRNLGERVAQVASQQVKVLICGALSWPLEQMLTAAGIEVVPHICGAVDDVLRAYAEGDLHRDAFLMPGCCGAAWRRRLGGRGGRHE